MFHVFNKFSTESELRVIMQCNKKETSSPEILYKLY